MSIFSRSKWKRFSCKFNTGGNLNRTYVVTKGSANTSLQDVASSAGLRNLIPFLRACQGLPDGIQFHAPHGTTLNFTVCGDIAVELGLE